MSSNPKILYTLIAYNQDILVDYYKHKGTYVDETKDFVFPKLKDTGKFMYTYQTVFYVFHKEPSGLSLLALCEDGFNKSVAFSYLEQVKRDLTAAYSPRELQQAKRNGLSEFRETVKMLNENFNSNFVDKTKLVLDEVGDLKEQVSVNLNKLIEREGKLHDLSKEAEGLSVSSHQFMKKVGHVKKNKQGLEGVKEISLDEILETEESFISGSKDHQGSVKVILYINKRFLRIIFFRVNRLSGIF